MLNLQQEIRFMSGGNSNAISYGSVYDKIVIQGNDTENWYKNTADSFDNLYGAKFFHLKENIILDFSITGMVTTITLYPKLIRRSNLKLIIKSHFKFS